MIFFVAYSICCSYLTSSRKVWSTIFHSEYLSHSWWQVLLPSRQRSWHPLQGQTGLLGIFRFLSFCPLFPRFPFFKGKYHTAVCPLFSALVIANYRDVPVNAFPTRAGFLRLFKYVRVFHITRAVIINATHLFSPLQNRSHLLCV